MREIRPLTLTRAGRALVPRLAALADANDEHFFGHLGAAERQAPEGRDASPGATPWPQRRAHRLTHHPYPLMDAQTQSTIRATFDGSNLGTLHFGEVLQQLASVHVESYRVDYRAGCATYYLPTGAVLDLGFEPSPEPIADEASTRTPSAPPSVAPSRPSHVPGVQASHPACRLRWLHRVDRGSPRQLPRPAGDARGAFSRLS